MLAHLDPARIVWDRFGALEPCEPQWIGDRAYWEEYNAAFFAANGLAYDPQRDSNVEAWVTAEDRAPFTAMVEQLLPRLAAVERLDDLDMILLAHWLPDLHLGSSVTNFAIHRLALARCIGFAISDRGMSAPFFALDCIDRCMRRGKVRKAMLLIMDQRHLLYRAAAIEAMAPENNACALVLDGEDAGRRRLAGYRRKAGVPPRGLRRSLLELAGEIGIAADESCLIASEPVLAAVDAGASTRAADPRLICAAPFVALAGAADWSGPFLMACHENETLTVVGIAGRGAA